MRTTRATGRAGTRRRAGAAVLAAAAVLGLSACSSSPTVFESQQISLDELPAEARGVLPAADIGSSRLVWTDPGTGARYYAVRDAGRECLLAWPSGDRAETSALACAQGLPVELRYGGHRIVMTEGGAPDETPWNNLRENVWLQG